VYFYHRWIEHWKEPVFEGSAFGVALHDAAAHWLMDNSYVPDWDELYRAAKVEEPSPELIQITQQYWETWLSNQWNWAGKKPVAVEKEITIEHPTLGTLTGKVDAIYSTVDKKHGEAFEIVDHKFLKNAHKKKSNHQMAFYSLLVPHTIRFTYEKVGLEDYELQEVSSLSVALRNIEKTIYYINKERFTVTPQKWFIQYCPFLKECGKCIN
jgi:predicted RecB family nuclease